MELPPPYQLTAENNPLAALLLLRRQRTRYLRSPLRWDFLQEYGTLLSFVGDHAGALRAFSSGDGSSPPVAGIPADEAADIVVSRAKGRQAVFVNEAHHIPLHRAFSLSLLAPLRRLGFTHFAAETLSAHALGLGRKYPSVHSGYYIREPLFGELLREAMRLGYEITAYESESLSTSCNRRDREQAMNLLARVFKPHPKARLFVHAGYSHIEKAGPSRWIKMAQWFRKLGGPDPLSVDQTLLRESSTLYDLQVAHPHTRYIRGRPDWTLLEGRRCFIAVPSVLSRLKQRPLLIQAHYEGEPCDAVPADQVILEKSEPALALAKGSFRVRALGADGWEAGHTRLSLR